MDGARLGPALACAVLLAGCRGAAAEPGGDAGVAWAADPAHGIDIPDDWKQLPEVAAAASDAAAEVLGGVGALRAHAWGEPSRGCYLAVIEAHGARRDRLRTVVTELEAALRAGLTLEEWRQSPDSEEIAELGGRFVTTDGRRLDGQLRIHLAMDRQRFPHAVAAACFYNDRQPVVCDDACTPLLAMLEPLELSSP